MISGSASGINKSGVSEVQPLSILTDVIALNVHLLISEASLESTHDTLNFEEDPPMITII